MKVYVDELPKSCEKCDFCEYFDKDAHGKGKHEVACYFNGSFGNILYGNQTSPKTCSLQSLSEHDKQVRKEVLGDLKEELKKNGKCSIRANGTMDFFIEMDKLNEILNQIQGDQNGTGNNQ
jgi:D-serine deaminase-like pyridoxal phosphate-dependent protein